MVEISYLLSAILVFAGIIFVHELGHFVFAKLLGFKVNEFSIGFGKKLWQKKYGETMYSIRAIPLGGYNSLPDIDAMDARITPSLYWKRFIVLVAGGMFNIISAVLIIFFLFLAVGTDVPTNTVAKVMADYPAENLLKPDDKIIQINNYVMAEENNNISFVKETKNLHLIVEREGEQMEFDISKNLDSPIGIQFATTHKPMGLAKAAEVTKLFFIQLTDMFAGFFASIPSSNGKDVVLSLAGPIGITDVMYKTQETQGSSGLAMLAAVISFQIGMFNLMPFPLLDGGRIALDTIQLITRNAIGNKGIELIQYAGLVIIGLIFLCGTGADIYRMFI